MAESREHVAGEGRGKRKRRSRGRKRMDEIRFIVKAFEVEKGKDHLSR
jgi:hypothetical protein